MTTTFGPALVPGPDAVPVWIPLVGTLLAVPVVYRSVTVVDAYEKCVFVDGGDVSATLEPGVHVTSPLRSPDHCIDLRTQTFELPIHGRAGQSARVISRRRYSSTSVCRTATSSTASSAFPIGRADGTSTTIAVSS